MPRASSGQYATRSPGSPAIIQPTGPRSHPSHRGPTPFSPESCWNWGCSGAPSFRCRPRIFAMISPMRGGRRVEALLKRAAHVEATGDGEDSAREHACLDCGHEAVNESDVLIAVWDREDARGTGGTAEVVVHARRLGRPLIIIDPATQTARREGLRLRTRCMRRSAWLPSDRSHRRLGLVSCPLSCPRLCGVVLVDHLDQRPSASRRALPRNDRASRSGANAGDRRADMVVPRLVGVNKCERLLLQEVLEWHTITSYSDAH